MRKYLFLFLFVGLFFTGCDLFDSTPVGRVEVLLTDNPLDGADSVKVVISRVELVSSEEAEEAAAAEEAGAEEEPSESGRITLTDTPQEFDLLKLQNGVTAALADAAVPAGSYSQLRLIVDGKAVIHYEDGSTAELFIPSGNQTGIKILLPEFNIESDADYVSVTIDFDAAQSFVPGGPSGYIFKPVIKPHTMTVNEAEVAVTEDTTDTTDSGV